MAAAAEEKRARPSAAPSSAAAATPPPNSQPAKSHAKTRSALPGEPSRRARDPVAFATPQFHEMHRRLAEAPIIGLSTRMQKKFQQTKKKIRQIREKQLGIFQSQVLVMAEVKGDQATAEEARYDDIWSSFVKKEKEVGDLAAEMASLAEAIDELNSLTDQ